MKARLTSVWVSIVFVVAAVAPAKSVDPPKDPPKEKPLKVVTMDLNGVALDTFLPFDEPFVLETDLPVNTFSVTCIIRVERRNGQWFFHPAYGSVIFKDEANSKLKAKFTISALPPKARIQITVRTVRSVLELTGFTAGVRREIESTVKNFVRTGVGYNPSAWTPVQTALINKFNSQFPGYRASFVGTILDVTNWTATLPSFNTLYTNYFMANNTLATLIRTGAAPSPVTNADALRGVFRYAADRSDGPVANALAQTLSTANSDWRLLSLGLSQIDAASLTVAPFPSLIYPSADMSATELGTYLGRIDRTIAALQSIIMFTNTRVIGDARGLVFINGGPINPGITTSLTATYNGVINDLRSTIGVLNGSRTQIADAIAYINAYEAMFTTIINRFKFTLEDQSILSASSSELFDTRGTWYIGADAGIAFIPKISEVQPYYGANIYFSPINKNADYTARSIRRVYDVDVALGVWLAKHACVHIGIIPNSIANTDRRVENTWGNNTALVGGGVRIGAAMRLTVGAAVVRGYSSNLLNTQKSLKATPYVSASVDINLLKLFGKVGTLLSLSN